AEGEDSAALAGAIAGKGSAHDGRGAIVVKDRPALAYAVEALVPWASAPGIRAAAPADGAIVREGGAVGNGQSTRVVEDGAAESCTAAAATSTACKGTTVSAVASAVAAEATAADVLFEIVG